MLKNKKLAKAIADQGWAMFISQLDYKSKMNGGLTVKIDRFQPLTKTCSSCGNIQKMPLDVKVYQCLCCRMTLDRDINAAINIKKWGMNEINRAWTSRIYACGDTSNGEKAIYFFSYVSLKQEKVQAIGLEASIPRDRGSSLSW